MKKIQAQLRRVVNRITFVRTRLKRTRRSYFQALKHHQPLRAQRHLKELKRLARVLHGLEHRKEALAKNAIEWQRAHKLRVQGDQVLGGTIRECVVLAAHASAAACSSGKRDNFYSQGGDWDPFHCISGPKRGHRDDCSSWLTSAHHSAGAPDPNGQNYKDGFTGTLYTGTKSISSNQLQPGDIIIYGSAPGHHTELYVGPGNRTIGHGSSPVDYGIVDLFGDGDYHCRRAPGV